MAYSFILSVVQDRRSASVGARLGCKPAPKLKNTWPFGIEHLLQMKAADKAQQFPRYLVSRFARMENKTHEHNIIGSKGFMTCDPENIKALLATQSNDYCLGSPETGQLLSFAGKWHLHHRRQAIGTLSSNAAAPVCA
jgi:hypothetical protein